ncbi:MAG: hypothetical protein E7265_01895 [Lachnospiraceae bacterium]|nr:hypothetical protein [Lachnospiraceae bacterium]
MNLTSGDVFEKIDKNYENVKNFERLIGDIEDIESRLNYISFVGLLYSELVTGVYSNINLESELNRIGESIEYTGEYDVNSNHILIVMTKASSKGGHSVIANNWIKWDEKRIYSIAFTDMMYEKVPDFINRAVSASGGNVFRLSGKNIEKAVQLQKVASRFSKIILLQHMNDIIPNLAFSANSWKVPVLLYNHANFKFSFGYSVADAILNLLPYDVEKTVNFRGVSRERSMLLQFPNKGSILNEDNGDNDVDFMLVGEDILDKYNIDKNKKLIVSMGQDYKYSDIVGVSFTEFVADLLKDKEDVQFVIIGPNFEEIKWKQLYEITSGKAKALGYLPREEAYSIISHGDLFIASFPMIASGVDIAEQYGIPYLIYDICGRLEGYFARGYVNSLSELKDTTEKILKKEEVLKQTKEYFYKLSKEEWVEELDKIYLSYNIHGSEMFGDVRKIDKEECINYQLMQDSGINTIKNIVRTVNIPNSILINFISNCMNLDDNILFEKMNMEYFMKMYCENGYKLKCYTRWLKLSVNNVTIGDYLLKKGIFTVSIYGCGDAGEALYEDLIKSGIEIECIIDKFRCGKFKKHNISPLGTRIMKSSILINTTVVSDIQIGIEYGNNISNIEIVSLFDIVDKISEEYECE